MRRLLLAPAAGVLALSLLTGCGEESGGSVATGGPEESPSAFDAATATLTDQPFCEQVDPTLAAGALGMPADKVKLTEQRKVGEKYENPVDEGKPVTSTVNSCTFGSTTNRLVVSVRPDGSADDLEKQIALYRGEKGTSSETCEVTDDTSFGDPAVVADCETAGVPRRSVVVTALVGGSGYFCSSTINVGAGPELRDATVEVCRDTLETLASDA